MEINILAVGLSLTVPLEMSISKLKAESDSTSYVDVISLIRTFWISAHSRRSVIAQSGIQLLIVVRTSGNPVCTCGEYLSYICMTGKNFGNSSRFWLAGWEVTSLNKLNLLSWSGRTPVTLRNKSVIWEIFEFRNNIISDWYVLVV